MMMAGIFSEILMVSFFMSEYSYYFFFFFQGQIRRIQAHLLVKRLAGQMSVEMLPLLRRTSQRPLSAMKRRWAGIPER
jgi:hypothetical protein